MAAVELMLISRININLDDFMISDDHPDPSLAGANPVSGELPLK